MLGGVFEGLATGPRSGRPSNWHGPVGSWRDSPHRRRVVGGARISGFLTLQHSGFVTETLQHFRKIPMTLTPGGGGGGGEEGGGEEGTVGFTSLGWPGVCGATRPF